MRRTLTLLLIAATTAVAGEEPSVRKWTDNTGQFSVSANLLSVNPETGLVKLQLEDGDILRCPLRRLSAADKDVAANWLSTSSGTSVQGIKWFEGLAQAKRTAAGEPTSRDDKPIMCFRVLGDLEGFM